MININAVQNFCNCLENAYCEIIQESWDDNNITLSLDKASGMIQICRSSYSASSYVEDSISPADNRIKTIMKEDKKNDVINYMADILEANNVFDDDTVAAFFVSCCYFGYMWDIFSVNNTDKVIGIFCSSFEDAKVKEYLSLLGRGILNRGYNSKLSIELIEKAIEMDPENEMSKLFDFVLKCVSFDKYITDIMQDYVRNEEEYNSFVDTVNNYMAALSESFNMVDRYLQSFILNHNDAADKIGNSFCTPIYCLYLPNIKSNHIMYGLLESQTAFKNQLLFVDPDLRKTMIKGSMPSHPDYLLENYVSMESISYADKKTYMFFGSTLVVDIFETRDFYKIYGALLNQYKKLKESNEKLERLQKERENLLDYHAHSWKHISFPSIVHDVAQQLLNQGDKDNANKLFRAYNSENLLANDLNLLKIMYSSSNAELMGKFKDSFIDPYVCDPYAKTLEEVMYEALDLVVFRTVMEDVDKRNELSEIKSSLDDRLSVLRESYTTEILSQDNNGSNKIKEWFCRYMYSLKVNASDLWTYIKLSTKGNNTAYIILSDMFINVFTNIMKYGAKSTEIGSLEITVDDVEINSLYFMKFSFTNPIAANSSKYPGNGVGINSIRNCLEKINSACEEFASDVVSVQVEKSDRLYTINIFVCEKAISTM